VTENDVLRERLRKIGDLLGRPVRIDSLEQRLTLVTEERDALRAEVAYLRKLIDPASKGCPCPDCDGAGSIPFVHDRIPCATCDGTGLISTNSDGV
jgi:hypothetical protein